MNYQDFCILKAYQLINRITALQGKSMELFGNSYVEHTVTVSDIAELSLKIADRDSTKEAFKEQQNKVPTNGQG